MKLTVNIIGNIHYVLELAHPRLRNFFPFLERTIRLQPMILWKCFIFVMSRIFDLETQVLYMYLYQIEDVEFIHDSHG